MARYLLVAHQTAESEELLATAQKLAGDDPQAKFTLLVPATPIGKLLVWEEGETVEVARRRAESARARLESHGVRVDAARTGDQDPTAAIADEMHAGHEYETIVISTLPAGVSKWLGMDVISRVRRNFPHHEVIHVVSVAATGAKATP